MRKHLNYANVMATLAVVLAVAGGSTAIAMNAAKNSVKSMSVKDGQIAGPDLAGVRVDVDTTTITDSSPGNGVPTTGEARASCARKERLLSGGAGSPEGVRSSMPSTGGKGNPRAWYVVGESDAVGALAVTAYALCLRAKP